MEISYHLLFEKLFQSKVRYLICGGFAAAAHGNHRYTVDLDLIIDFEKSNLAALSDVVYRLGFKKRVPVTIESLVDKKYRDQLLNEKNMLAYSLFHPKEMLTIDLMVHFDVPFETVWEKRETRIYSGYEVHYLSLNDLIEMKEKAGREIDKQDVAVLKKFLKENDDHSKAEEPSPIYSFQLDQYLKWLADARHFMNEIRTPEEKIRNEKIRKGEF